MKKITCIILISIPFILKADYWIQKADFGGTARFGVANFSIGNKGYIGLGSDAYPSYHFLNELWEYDPSADSWTQKASFPGAARYTPIAFAIGTKGYVGVGWNQVNSFNDLWEYDQTSNSWTQKGNFPGPLRQGGIAIVLNSKAYAGFGVNGSTLLNDFYSYNDTNDTWTPLANFSGPVRVPGFGFAINNRVYVGCGIAGGSTFFSDTWEYNPSLNTWSQKADFPGTGRYAGVYFTVNNKGYTGLGKNASTQFNDFYEYDPVTDFWIGKASCTANIIEFGFTIGSKGYAGTGLSASLGISKQFWEYTPDSTTAIAELNADNFISTFPNPTAAQVTLNFKKVINGSMQLFNSFGELLGQTQISSSMFSTDMSNKPKGIYFISVTDASGNKVVKKIVKM